MPGKPSDDGAEVRDDLLTRAVAAVNRGDLKDAHALAKRVLADDGGNLDASTLLATESQPTGEVRRLTVLFCDLVGSTDLSGRLDPELYRGLISRYRKLVLPIVTERHGGVIADLVGDGMLALFGFPTIHGDDTERGVIAALEIAAEVEALSGQIAQAIGEPLAVRAALHRGLMYVDSEQVAVYGLAVNVAARLQGLAEPGQVVVSDQVRLLIGDRFDLEAGEAKLVKGVDLPLQPYVVLGRKSSERVAAIRTPLVGRSAELDVLRTQWSRAIAEGSAAVGGVTVVGEAGLGKSRLVAALVDEATVDGGEVVTLTGSPDHHDVGFHPLRRLIETRCGIGPGTTAHLQVARLEQDLVSLGFTLLDTLPLIAPILGLDPEAGYAAADADGNKLSEDIAKAAAEYLVACLGQGPAIVVVDDQHAVDDATNDLIARILRCGRPQTLLVATSRIGGVAETETIHLQPLRPDACLALIDAIAPTGPGGTIDRNELVKRSDGVPLFLEELVRSSSLDPVEERHRPVRSEASTVPDVLYEPLMARLYTSSASVAVVSAASTIGREVDLGLLTQSVELAQAEVHDAVESLIGGGILERIATDRSSVRFRHELVREVAYDLIAPSRRREVHARVASALSESVANDERSDWTIIAKHFERADRPADAANAWGEASADARRRGLVAEARLRLGAGIDQVALLPAGHERNELEVELRLRRGFLASSVEGMSSQEATADYQRCLELTLDIPHAPNMVSTLTAMWGYYTARADLRKARQVSTTLHSLVSEEWGAFWRPQNIASFAMLDWFAGDFVQAEDQLQLAVDALYAREAFDSEAVAAWYLPTHPTVAMHVHLAIARFMVGDVEGADEHGRRAIELAENLPFPQGPWSAAYTRWYLAWMYMERGEDQRSFALLSEVSTIGEQHGYDSWSLIAMTQHAATTAARDVRTSSGIPLAPAAAILGSLVSAWQMVELRNCLTIYLTTLGRVVARGGDVVGARTHLEESLELARSTGMHFYDAETLRAVAHLEPESGEVVRRLGEALAVARRQGARPFELRIALDLHSIRGESAVAELRAAVDGFRPDASYPELDDARARLARHGR
ncbi:MAG: adenylate/guanylate cyclase protein [Marmoricola sp.]|nr:adenylate/guanylate cyclase protein [Marmoricola sp.]